MKYRFRKVAKRVGSRRRRGASFRLAGRNTLRILPPLPEPIEEIRISDDELLGERRRRPRPSVAFGKLWRSVLVFFGRLFAELSAAYRRLARFFGAQVKRFSVFIAHRKAIKKEKKIDSLPLLFGASLSALLVCFITASYVLLSLFAPYARAYSAVTVPALQGRRLDEVELDGKFNLLVQYENNPDVESGRIISQSPAAGVTRKIYERGGFCDVRVTVSKQTSQAVPEGLVGSAIRDASLSLLNRGISFTVEEKFSDIKKGTVLLVYPLEGEGLSPDGSVTLTVSAGQEENRAVVPSLSGLTESEAIFRIRSSGLTVGSVTYVRSDKRAGTVIRQSPSAHLSVSPTEPVSFTVSAGEDFSAPTVPDLYGLSVESAKKKLLSVGLTVSSVYSVSSAAGSGTVIYQSPIAGTPITSSVTSVELHISN